MYTVERIPELAKSAKTLLEGLSYDNIEFLDGDGTQGWPEHAPYDAIIVAAAAPAVPESLKAQLKMKGRLVIPVGKPYGQMLKVVTRTKKGFTTRDACPCIFVKLIGREGYEQ